MNDNDASKPNDTGVSRRVTLTLAAGVAALGVALGFAQFLEEFVWIVRFVILDPTSPNEKFSEFDFVGR